MHQTLSHNKLLKSLSKALYIKQGREMNEAAAKFMPDGGCIKALMIKGRERGYLTIEQIMECIPSGTIEQEQLADIVTMIEGMGVEVAR